MPLFFKSSSEAFGETLGKEVFNTIYQKNLVDIKQFINASNIECITDFEFEVYCYTVIVFKIAILMNFQDKSIYAKVYSGFIKSLGMPILKLRQIGLRQIKYEEAVNQDTNNLYKQIGMVFSILLTGNVNAFLQSYISLMVMLPLKQIMDLCKDYKNSYN